MDSNVLIGVISTHAHFTALCRQVGQIPGQELLVFEGALEEALPGLDYFKREGVETIVTTRGNAIFLRKHTDIPIVAVPEDKFDVLYPIAKAYKQYGKKITLFFYKEAPVSPGEIADILGFKPKTVIFKDIDHLEFLLEKLHDIDQVVIGGGFVCQLASALGFIAEPVNLSKESFWAALESAKEVALVRRKARQEAVQFKAVLDWAHEGIIATDEHDHITLFNKAAEKLFNIKAEQVLGLKSKEALSKAKLHEVLASKEAVLGEILQVEDAKLAVNKVPILNDQKIGGVVANFQAVQVIQDIEEKIRREQISNRNAARYNFSHIKGESSAIQNAVSLARQYAATEEAVLIMGESGTGKELFAQSIHSASNRRQKTFMAVNCAAIPAALLESELFGYTEGSFTGARKGGKPGLFELAHGGTLFLDEIGEMPVEVQAKLLRVIQEKEVRRVGGEQNVRVDVRIVAATHRELWNLVVDGKFRRDLFYRLDVLRLTIPSLRERPEDIGMLAGDILNNYPGLSVKQKRVVSLAITGRPDYAWPGNVRELENVVRRLVVLTKDLPEQQAFEQAKHMLNLHCGARSKSTSKTREISVSVDGKLKDIIAEVEKEIIKYILHECDGDRTKAARKLGIGRTTLWRKQDLDSPSPASGYAPN